MKTRNFPAKQNQRRIGALSRLHLGPKRDSGYDSEKEQSVLLSRITQNARSVRTKISRVNLGR